MINTSRHILTVRSILTSALCILVMLACQDMKSQKEEKVTESGYRYIILNDAPGETVKPGQYALVHTVMMHQDSLLSDTRINPGKPSPVKIEADQSVRRGSSGPVQDLLKLLSIGDSARLYYPVDSFPTTPPRLKNFKEVTYDVVIFDILESEEAYQAYLEAEREKIAAPRRDMKQREQEVTAQMAEFYSAYKRGAKDNLWQTTPSGLKYIHTEKSGSGIRANAGENVEAHYYGIFAADGQHFDNSFSRASTFKFAVGTGQVIKGWDEAFALLEKGDKAVILVPGDLAYGPQGYPGVIPPNAALLFYVELIGIAGR
jgi:FKBP-type peptidyl-prolyl cis-trans isomerase